MELQFRKPQVTRVCRSELGEEKATQRNSEDLQRSPHKNSAGYRSEHICKEGWGKATGNNCHCCLVAKSYLTLLQPHGLLPTRLLCPWDFLGMNSGAGCISFSKGSSQPRDQTQVLCWQADSLPLSHYAHLPI